MAYTHQDYPRQMYHKTKPTCVVNSLDEQNALGAGWGSAGEIEAQKQADAEAAEAATQAKKGDDDDAAPSAQAKKGK